MADDPADAPPDRGDGRLPRRSGEPLGRHPAEPAAATRSASPSASWSTMQEGLRAALQQKTRLAALGGAVSKINHDLRNILSTAALVSDRLTASGDPEVRRNAKALLRRHRPRRRALQHHPQLHPRRAAGPASDALSPGRAGGRGRPHLARDRRRLRRPSATRSRRAGDRGRPGSALPRSSPIWSRTRSRRAPPASPSRRAGPNTAKAPGPAKTD